MSRLTSRAPFNRPSVFDVLPSRPIPLSPPETEMESGLPMPQESQQDDPNPLVPEAMAQQAPMATESPAAHFRRVSNLAYTNSTLSRREPRPIQRQSRWLVMVVPPASLTREPPMLGHTLSSAPAGRFSNGILIPLFPTLYGQLTAIAREFNMPSTTGLCIYLQLSESGASMLTPRISDESWQLLWGHFFSGDERAAQLPPHGLPISGRIEFDIDLRRARWFDAWMGHPRRERGESENIYREPSVAPTHWRGDSRTSLFPTETGLDESPPPDANLPAAALSSRTPTQRQLPRPLLLERRDLTSMRSLSRHTSRTPSISHEPPSPDAPTQRAEIPPTEVTFVPKALSPVAQEQEEPQTARKADLQTMVHQWRQTSSVTGATNALTAAGQPSLDPANMPSGTDVELDLNDFAWSISSAGPPSESPLSPDWSEGLPSVHLLGRLQGSVCLTPSVATSFGPLDYDRSDSPVSCVSRRPSPDLGMRMLDYVPLTPTTATSWGPDDSPSPLYSTFEFEYHAPSVDIGVRGIGSRPVTPSTATSWGPGDSPSLVYSIFESEYGAPSVDIGVRGMGSRPVTPSTATSWGPPESPLSLPPSPTYIRTPDAGERSFPDLEVHGHALRAAVFPYYSAWETQPWGHVWPYQAHRRRENTSIVLSTPVRRTRINALLPEWPDFAALYPSNPTVERAAANKSQPVELPQAAGYPFLNIYPIVYPHNLDDIYPASSEVQGALVNRSHHQAVPPPRVRSSSLHPGNYRDSCLPEWPDFASLYPSDSRSERAAVNKSQPVTLLGQVGYPFLEIYPIAYPYTLGQIYPVHPSAAKQAIQEKQGLFKASGLIDTPRKGLLPEWPDFASLYPANPKVERVAFNKSLPVTLQRAEGYPNIVLYETAYPHHLNEIYPAVHSAPSAEATLRFRPKTPTSPLLLLEFPDPRAERVSANKSQPVRLPSAGYPFLSIYPSVYPWTLSEIYNPTEVVDVPTASPRKAAGASSEISVRLPAYSGYPMFNLYPAASGYPTFEIYPPVLARSPVTVVSSSKLIATYPAIEIYEPVYPYLIIYPQTQLNIVDSEVWNGPAVATKDVPPSRKPRLTHLDLHHRVFSTDTKPIFFQEQETVSPISIRRPRKTHHELHLIVFPAMSSEANNSLSVCLPTPGYPFQSVYPSVYPWSLEEIYGPPAAAAVPVASPHNVTSSSSSISVQLPVYSGYPMFNLYPAYSGYPTFEIYPHILTRSSVAAVPTTRLIPGYPAIELYEPVYPHLVIYPQAQLNVVQNSIPARPSSPRKRAPTPGPGRHRSHGSRSPLSTGQETDALRRLSRSPIQKDLTVPPLPAVAITDVRLSRKPRLTHLDLHRLVFGADANPTFSEARDAETFIPVRRPRKTHRELHLMVFAGLSSEDTQGLDDFVTELPHRPPVPSRAPALRRSRSGTVSSQVSADLSREDPQGAVSNSELSRTFSPARASVPQRSRSGTVNSQMSVDLSREASQGLHDTVAEIPRRTPASSHTRHRSRSGTVSSQVSADLSHNALQGLEDVVAESPRLTPAFSPGPTRQRSRSGTVSSRASQPPGPPPSFRPPSPPPMNTGRARRPSISTNVSIPSSDTSPSPSTSRSTALPPPSTRSSLAVRSRSPSVSESPSPARQSSVLSRVRSMNTPARPVGTASPGSDVGGLDRSTSLSDTRRGGGNRQSIVLERARMFTVSEKGVEVSDVLPALPPMSATRSRPISKLDRSKLPFA